MTTPPRFKNIIDNRRWSEIRDSWLGYVPSFSGPGAKPDPGLERLIPLQGITLPESKGLVPDIMGVRSNMLWEAVFLFLKCAHSHLAAQRLGAMGMASWSLFNAYHSAYLGARGVMALLGVSLPNLPQGGQFLVDVYPQPKTKRKVKALSTGGWQFGEMLLAKLGGLDQRGLWEAFQRTLRVADIPVCDASILEELLSVPPEEITPPRNAFLYKAGFWPGDDLLADSDVDKFSAFLGTELDAEAPGFLLRLSFDVYRLFECLIVDLAEQSGPIREQISGSRIINDPMAEDLAVYNAFVVQVTTSAPLA